MGKMISTTFEKNEILSEVQKITPKKGEILLFYVKTDDNGIPLTDLETVQDVADNMNNILPEGVSGIFLFDKICLFSIENSKRVIERLKKVISDIEEATDTLGNIENRNSAEPFLTLNIAADELDLDELLRGLPHDNEY